jgi:16S rRNA processing protein RimM
VDSIEVVVGRIGKPHGIRGEVTVDVRSDEPDRRFQPGARLMTEPQRGSAFAHRTLTVQRARWHQTTLLVTFDELSDRNTAETARGVVLRATVAADETPEDPDEFYDHQLEGLAAYDVDGAHLGEIAGLVHGAQDLLRVSTIDGREALVPFVAALVPEVDIAGGRVVIADRPGLVQLLPDDVEEDEDDEKLEDAP